MKRTTVLANMRAGCNDLGQILLDSPARPVNAWQRALGLDDEQGLQTAGQHQKLERTAK
jgi:hypothetical protein